MVVVGQGENLAEEADESMSGVEDLGLGWK